MESLIYTAKQLGVFMSMSFALGISVGFWLTKLWKWFVGEED